MGFDFMSAASGPDGIILDGFGTLRAVRSGNARDATTQRPYRQHLQRARRAPGGDAVATRVAPSRVSVRNERRRRGARRRLHRVDGFRRARTQSHNTPALAERTVSWSADGSRVGYLSEASGEYQFVVRAADGTGSPRTFTLGERPGVFSDFKWSPDGRHVAYRDDRLSMWMLDLETGRSTVAGREAMGTGGPRPTDWSPDGKWLAYTRQMPSHMGAAFLYSVESGRSVQATDGRADVSDPVFDASGQYLYFLASSNRPMSTSATMAAFDHPVTISAYALLLASNATLPTTATTAGGPTRVDTAGIRSRVVRFRRRRAPIRVFHIGAARNHIPRRRQPLGGGPTQVAGVSRSVWRLTWPDKKVEEVLRDADGFDVIANRSTALVRKGGRSTFIELADLRGAQGDVPPAMPAGRALTIPTLPATIDVRAEWKQIYHETWRLQRDLLYAANYNGLDLTKAEAHTLRSSPASARAAISRTSCARC